MKWSTITADELQTIVNNSNSIAEVLRKVNYSACKSSYKSFYKATNRLNVNFSPLKKTPFIGVFFLL